MDINKRISQLLALKNWSEYRLACEAKLSRSTVSNIFKRDTVPSIPTLIAICSAFELTLSQFFQEGGFADLNEEQKEMLDRWQMLSREQKRLVDEIIKNFK